MSLLFVSSFFYKNDDMIKWIDDVIMNLQEKKSKQISFTITKTKKFDIFVGMRTNIMMIWCSILTWFNDIIKWRCDIIMPLFHLSCYYLYNQDWQKAKVLKKKNMFFSLVFIYAPELVYLLCSRLCNSSIVH